MQPNVVLGPPVLTQPSALHPLGRNLVKVLGGEHLLLDATGIFLPVGKVGVPAQPLGGAIEQLIKPVDPLRFLGRRFQLLRCRAVFLQRRLSGPGFQSLFLQLLGIAVHGILQSPDLLGAHGACDLRVPEHHGGILFFLGGAVFPQHSLEQVKDNAAVLPGLLLQLLPGPLLGDLVELLLGALSDPGPVFPSPLGLPVQKLPLLLAGSGEIDAVPLSGRSLRGLLPGIRQGPSNIPAPVLHRPNVLGKKILVLLVILPELRRFTSYEIVFDYGLCLSGVLFFLLVNKRKEIISRYILIASFLRSFNCCSLLRSPMIFNEANKIPICYTTLIPFFIDHLKG